ncbi:MFS transporter [Saccharopolyspora endophytica]|uniref:MHS family MFS transporter n=1 Tax=Saccharopolyspora endophytica TaxID=543886 RepID=A0ABS5DG11_9PSEU|nr:MFS transporter [Saccharopolyspora endophytica]MBQ0925218.1 MHS family MFS transporter [Saccharopolyspora endophytica]
MAVGVAHPDKSTVRKAAFASAVGNTIELYDFLIYGTAAGLVFNKLFFPSGDPWVGALLAFATFGAGFLARPLGAAVIGHFGDLVGRKLMLVITLSVTGVCTAAIGLLPTYQQVGVWAPAMLVALRLVQGFFLGGEQGGAVLMAVEHAPAHRHGWYGGWTFIGSPTGMFLATGAFAAATAISGEQFLEWGWRVPFLLSLVLVGVGLYVRLRLAESPEFAAIRQRGERARLPVAEAFATAWRQILLAAGVNLGFNAFIFIMTTFLLTYGTEKVGVTRDVMLLGSLAGSAAQIAGILLFSHLSDRLGRTQVMLGGGTFLAAFAFPLFWLIDTGSPALIVLAMIVGYGGAAAVFGPMAAFCAELFPTRVRYTGVSLGYQSGSVLGGGLSPVVATALLTGSGGQSWPISAYLVFGAAITIVCLALTGEPTRWSRRDEK